VDGCSDDESRQVAEQFADRVLSDGGRGLAAARRLGVEAAAGEYVLILGPDFELPPDFIGDFLAAADTFSHYSGISAQVRIFRPETVWDRGIDCWWQFERQPGEKDVIGTPCLFKRDFIKMNNFYDGNIASDDTELCLRLSSLGYKMGIVPVIAGDLPGKTWMDIKKKFTASGYADGQFFQIQGDNWNFRRKARSLVYAPRRALKGACSAVMSCNLYGVLFMFVYGWLRWIAMIKYLICNNKEDAVLEKSKCL